MRLLNRLQVRNPVGVRYIEGMAPSFDPFRLDQRFEPEPVSGSLSPVNLVDVDDPPGARRPYWLRTMVWALMGILALSSILNQAVNPHEVSDATAE